MAVYSYSGLAYFSCAQWVASKKLSGSPQRPVRRRPCLSPRCDVPPAGRYGGPPVDRRIRPSWGGGPVKDPITESGDYLWDNKETWQRTLDSETQKALSTPQNDQPEKQTEGGFLSLSRALALDSVHLDLSRELTSGETASLEDQVAAARRLADFKGKSQVAGEEETKSNVQWKAVLAPTSRQSKRLEKRKTQAVAYMAGTNAGPSPSDRIESYDDIKKSLQLYTLVLALAFSASAALTYPPEVAASFAMGCVFSLVYTRMLSTGVESLGRSDIGSAAKASIAQPRLLVPVVLVMVFNRWNVLLVPEYGVVELQLIPMLLGFFTYKAATIVRTFQDVLIPPKDSSSSSS